MARGRLNASLRRVARIPPSVLLVAPRGSVNAQTKRFVDLTDSWDVHGRRSGFTRSSQDPLPVPHAVIQPAARRISAPRSAEVGPGL